MAVNPLRADPTRTAGIRRAFQADTRRRFAALAKACDALIVGDDAFGLEESSVTTVAKLVGNAKKQQFRFLQSKDKVKEFRTWLALQVDKGVLEGGSDRPWMAKYIRSAQKQAATRAYLDTHSERLKKKVKQSLFTKEAFIAQAFDAPEAVEKIELLYTRVFTNLKGITEAMSDDLSRILADGIAHGHNPKKVAGTIRKSISSFTKRRALTLARTEIIRAHAEGQLSAFKQLGVEEVGVQAEFATAGDDKVCPKCAALEGNKYALKDAQGIIPVHPNCRCAWIPYIPEAAKQRTKRKRRK